jgi:hypothetical protein
MCRSFGGCSTVEKASPECLEVKFSELRLLVVLGSSYAGSCIAPVQHLWPSQLSPSQQEAPQEPRESPESAETEETRFPRTARRRA